ncbi:MAG TPA: glutamate-5-semialdehyde dehydrogenase [Candidatus Limnocylindria bacterium]|nr:glutamate-5-semialdehyde dehydrogenase [Candidatus Limnocylindria bacterium]
MSLLEEMIHLAERAKKASRQLATLPTDAKNACLRAMADALVAATPALREANARDLEVGRSLGLSGAMMERLTLDEKRIAAMANGLREVAALPDPVGRVLDERVRPNGLELKKISTPIGVVVIIYESRPNVTADAASLCFKTGNATILRGGKEALNSNLLIASTMIAAGKAVLPEFPEHAIQVVPTADREAIPALLSLTHLVDLCMPRGGEGLIRAVTACSKVPVIKHYKGVCHVYVDKDANLDMANEILFNAKAQRPSVCNSAETVLVDRAVAKAFLPMAAKRLSAKNVEWRGDEETVGILSTLNGTLNAPLKRATEEDFSTEYNDYILNARIVDGVGAAIEHINRYGSNHSDTVVTANADSARRFLAEVDSAAVYWNASTRFTDGGEFGMGAEIGISTDKIGARGPMGLEELCSYKWIGIGTGQVRA